ncbi:MAG: hypothetical protein LBN95_12110 [Prevotellaceae bacterium]|jgi:hypothetical protein|nr:hypothetical protein [Prevotellaceae bacterium]
MRKILEKKLLPISDEERQKFICKITKAWSEYMSDFKNWNLEVNKVREKYSDGFGLGLPNMCVDIEDLFKNFIEIETKKSKNRKYRQMLLSLSEIKLTEDDWVKIMEKE